MTVKLLPVEFPTFTCLSTALSANARSFQANNHRAGSSTAFQFSALSPSGAAAGFCVGGDGVVLKLCAGTPRWCRLLTAIRSTVGDHFDTPFACAGGVGVEVVTVIITIIIIIIIIAPSLVALLVSRTWSGSMWQWLVCPGTKGYWGLGP